MKLRCSSHRTAAVFPRSRTPDWGQPREFLRMERGSITNGNCHSVRAVRTSPRPNYKPPGSEVRDYSLRNRSLCFKVRLSLGEVKIHLSSNHSRSHPHRRAGLARVALGKAPVPPSVRRPRFCQKTTKRPLLRPELLVAGVAKAGYSRGCGEYWRDRRWRHPLQSPGGWPGKCDRCRGTPRLPEHLQLWQLAGRDANLKGLSKQVAFLELGERRG